MILHPNISEFEFYPKILRVFGFYSLNFEGIWILHPKVLEFVGVKSKHSQTLRGKIEISKYHGVKLKNPQTLGGKFQILKFQGVKSKHSQTLKCKI